MNIFDKARRLFTFISIIVSIIVGGKAEGMNLVSYDFDSLIYLGPQIVEGTLGKSFFTNNFTSWKFNITTVHEGQLKTGQSIDVTALDFFCVNTNGSWGGSHLEEGDQLFLFLARTSGDGFLYKIPPNEDIYWPAPSGVRIVDKGKVFGFSQYNNPGPYIAVLAGGQTNSDIPSVEQFRKQIQESIPRVEKWRPLLDQKARTNDIPELLAILRQRAKQVNEFGKDFIAIKVCQHLTELQNITAMFAAAHIGGYRWYLSGGFGTVSGHEFLLKEISDKRESMEEKIVCANLMARAGEGTSEEWHLKHIAELVAQPKQSPKLQVALLDSLHEIARWFHPSDDETNLDSNTMADRKEAGRILTQLSGETDSQQIKYKIDLVLPALGLPSLSPKNCLLQLDNYDPKTRELKMRCHISGVAGMNPIPLVFLNTKTGQKWNTQSMLYFQGDETASPSDAVVPHDVPHGHYKVFYEFTESGKITSTSLYFELDL